MEADEYQKIKEVFNSVLEMGPEARRAFLDKRCGGEIGLRSEVERLLASYDSEFMELPAVREVAELVVPDELRNGRQIGRYTVLRSIGKGGMGEVYLAEDGRLSRQVALKVLPEDFAVDADRLLRFEQEAKASSALNHPNILTIFEFAEEAGSHFIVSEYVSGQTLRRKVSGGALPVSESLDIAIQVAAALDAAHSNGIVHRDIKPENIMVRDDGLVKVLDFGLAKFTDHWFASEDAQEGSPTRKQLTTPGIIMGTVQYMSPEQTRAQLTDERTDIWSLGCVLYEMVAGRPPFASDNTADLIAEIVKTHPAPLAGVVDEVPERLGEIVAKSLEKNADERYQTAKDLLIDLRRVKKKLEVEAELSRPNSLRDRTTNVSGTLNTGEDSSGIPEKPISSAEYILDGIKLHRRTAIGIFGLIAAMLGTTAYVARTYWRSPDNRNEARFTYAKKISLAAKAIETSNLVLAKQYLDELKPEKGQEDLRSFEWGYISRLHAEREASQPITLVHPGWVEGTAFSSDGNTLATAGTDGIIRLWDVASGEAIRTTKVHEGWAWSAVFSPDGRKILSAGDNKAVLSDAESGDPIFTIGSESDPVSGQPVFSLDGKTIICVSDGKITFSDAASGRSISERIADGDLLFSISTDGKYVGVRGKDGSALILDSKNGRKISTVRGHSALMTDLEFSPDSKYAVSGSTDGTAKLWDVRSGRDLRTFKGHTGEIYDVAFSPNGRILATGNTDNTVKLWNAEKGYEITTLKGHAGRIQAISFSPDGSKLATGSSDNTVKIWSVPKNEGRGVLRGHAGPVKAVAFSPDRKLIASAGEDKTGKIWDAVTEEERQTLAGHSAAVNSIEFSPDNRTTVTGSQDKKIRVWDVVTGRQVLTFGTQHEGTDAFFSPDGRTIATIHWFGDDTVRLWDVVNGKQRCSFATAGWGVEFSRDSRSITVSGDANKIRRWNIDTCLEVWAFTGGPRQEFAALFAPDAKLIGIEILNSFGSLKLFDPESGKELASITGHASDISKIKMSPDGKRLVTSGEDSSIKLWDIVTGQELLSISANAGAITGLAFSSDGSVLAASANDGTVRLWRSTPL